MWAVSRLRVHFRMNKMVNCGSVIEVIWISILLEATKYPFVCEAMSPFLIPQLGTKPKMSNELREGVNGTSKQQGWVKDEKALHTKGSWEGKGTR